MSSPVLPPHRSVRRRRRRRFLLPAFAAVGAAAFGAAASAAVVALCVLRGGNRAQSATAAHVLLSAASLAVPSGPNWRYEEGISGVFLSGDVQATPEGLRVASGGLYLLYGQFAVTCTATSCPPGNVTLQLHRAGSSHPLLAVPLALPDGSGSGPTRSGLAQAVGQLRPGDVLSFRMVGDVQGDEWQMAQDEREGNFVGLLRIAGGG
ncbi:uncharacterized protein LOC112530991 [Gallus gallus]|uniref:uncharacterized protein LOC112530991 n=1 Tax=Gallus gallus TaxID=9031 RepID=UPI001AE84658|nr:uncharacterized protein LOC112530991 [Gallus gallus]